MPKLAVDRDGMLEFGRLDRSLQEKVVTAFGKFENATYAGLHLERINHARDPRLRSIRIDKFWRAIVLAPESGDSYMLLKVLPHDDAYAWATRRKASVNTALGTFEVRDVVALEEELPSTVGADTADAEPLLAQVSDADLARLGIDEQVLRFARTLTDVDQLDAAKDALPQTQYDVLLGLAMGMSPEEVWAEMAGALTAPGTYDPEDLTAAVERTTERVVLVSGPDELMEVLSYPFAQWRVYLHPIQHRVAYGSFSGPARVTGGPGTGKTVTALHRAKHLAATATRDRSVLLTTFTKTLTDSLENDLRLLIDDDALLRRIEVCNVDKLANRVVAQAHGRLALLGSDEKAWWQETVAEVGLDVSETFLAQEWRQVVLTHSVDTLDDYLAVTRTGRGRRLGRQQRQHVWPALAAFTSRLRREHRWTHETICLEAARLLETRRDKPYEHIIVDEAQDLGPWQWHVLRAAVAPGPDDLFIAGDTHQRIYTHRVSLRRLGIDVAGRSERLTVNYRTTAEILGWSLGILRGETVDDMNGGLDTLAGCRSALHGDPPTLRAVRDQRAELAQLVSTVRDWLSKDVQPGQIGVAARSARLVDEAVAALSAAGIRAVSLARRAARDGEVSVTSMHRMKGLEFRCVAVIGVDDHLVPPAAAITPAEEDQATHDLDVQRERCLLFVACTRAREELAVSWSGAPSALLPPR